MLVASEVGAAFLDSYDSVQRAAEIGRKTLEPSLMAKVQRLMEWAVQNDMITSDIVIGDGVRGPKTAHKMCVSWNIQYRWGSIITLDALK